MQQEDELGHDQQGDSRREISSDRGEQVGDEQNPDQTARNLLQSSRIPQIGREIHRANPIAGQPSRSHFDPQAYTITQAENYMKQQLEQESAPQASELLHFTLINNWFGNSLPANLRLSSSAIYGECRALLGKTSSSSDEQFRAVKFLANECQLLLKKAVRIGGLFIFGATTGYNLQRIKYKFISNIAVGLHYGQMIIAYQAQASTNKSQSTQHKQVLLEFTDCEEARRLRQHLVRYMVAEQGEQGDRVLQEVDRTVLTHLLGKRANESKNLAQAAYQKCLATSCVDVRQLRQKMLRKEQPKGKDTIEAIAGRLKVMVQLYDKSNEGICNSYIVCLASKHPSKQVPELNECSLLKVYSKSLLACNEALRLELLQQACLSRDQQIITPYVPLLLSVREAQHELLFQYRYFQIQTLQDLVHNRKSQIRHYVRQIVAELVVGLGHVHECGYQYGHLTLADTGLNYDGHLLIVGAGKATRSREDDSGRPGYTQDWRQLGMMLCELVAGLQGQGAKENALVQMSVQSRIKQLQQKGGIEQDLVAMVMQLLEKDPLKALGCSNDYHQVLSHQYFSGVDRKKLNKRSGEPILKTKKTKIKDSDKKMQLCAPKPKIMLSEQALLQNISAFHSCLFTRQIE